MRLSKAKRINTKDSKFINQLCTVMTVHLSQEIWRGREWMILDNIGKPIGDNQVNPNWKRKSTRQMGLEAFPTGMLLGEIRLLFHSI